MKTIELDMPTRVIVSAALGDQRGTLETLAVPHDILNKIKLTEEDRDTFSVEIPNNPGSKMVDQDALLNMAGVTSLTTDLEKEEIKVLLKILTTWDKFGHVDYPYISALVKVLQA